MIKVLQETEKYQQFINDFDGAEQCSYSKTLTGKKSNQLDLSTKQQLSAKYILKKVILYFHAKKEIIVQNSKLQKAGLDKRNCWQFDKLSATLVLFMK